MVEKSWTVITAVQKYPHIIKVLYQYNINSSCWGGDGRLTLEQAALKHNIDPENLVNTINNKILDPRYFF